jgi:AbrB family looped-hinge helix DNA binding protein
MVIGGTLDPDPVSKRFDGCSLAPEIRYFGRVDSSGRVTIPKALRDWLGLHAGAEVVIATDGDVVTIRKATAESADSAPIGEVD